MKNLIRYLLILFVTLLMAVLTGGEFTVFLLAFELILPIFLAGSVRYLLCRLKVSMEVPDASEKEEEFTARITLVNKGILPVSCAEVTLVCRDAFDGRELVKTFGGAVSAGKSACLEFGYAAAYAGRLEVQLREVRVYDCFHFLWGRLFLEKEWRRVLIKPHIAALDLDGNMDAAEVLEEGEASSARGRGDDVSEIADIRPYRAGDTLHRIHWKLSAKTEELLVKEFGNPSKRVLYIFIDFYSDKQETWNHEAFDGMVSLLASFSVALLVRRKVHEVFWYHAQEERLCSALIEKEADLYEAVGGMVTAGSGDKPYDFQPVFGDGAKEQSAFFIDRELSLHTGEKYRASMTEKRFRELEQKKG